MTAPLNGLLLNGGTPYATWAWGWARAEATATAEPAVNRVYSDARAVAVAEATSAITTDRLAFLNGEQQPYAESTIEATRYAGVEGSAEALSELPLSATRYAWTSPTAIAAQATSAGVPTHLIAVYADGSALSPAHSEAYAERWKIFAAEQTAWAESTLAADAAVRIALMVNRKTPAQARSWMAESRLTRLQVRQQYARGTSVSRAVVRAIPNSAIGRGRLELDATALADELRVNVYHAFKGVAEAGVEAAVNPDRIRIIVGGAVGVADARLAPTIERGGERFSYNSGVASANATVGVSPTVVRRLLPVSVVTESLVDVSRSYFVRSVRGSAEARAAIAFAERLNAWHWGKGAAIGEATMPVDWVHFRWREAAAVATVEASTTATATHIRDVAFGSAESTAHAAATPVISRYVSGGDRQAQASTTFSFRAVRYVSASERADAALSIVAYARRGRIMSGSLTARAEEHANALRIVWQQGVDQNAVASTTRLMYRLNIDSLAPVRRTIDLSPSGRLLALPATNREYRVA